MAGLKKTGWAFCAAVILMASGCAEVRNKSSDGKPSSNANYSADDAAARIKADIAWLADDAREGREAGTPGYDAAAAYVAKRFEQMGMRPGVNGQDWLQPVTLQKLTRDLDAAEMTLIERDGAKTSFVHLQDYLIGRGPGGAGFDVSAPVVFVGYGVKDQRHNYDDYSDIDARGKIVAFFSGAPDYLHTEERAYFASTRTKLRLAESQGAVGALFLTSRAGEKRFSWSRAVANPLRSSMAWKHPDGRTEVAARGMTATATLSTAGAEKLFAGADIGFEDLRGLVGDKKPLPAIELGKSVRLRGKAAVEEVMSSNVIGLIEGADPALKDEIVILTAHLDHVGVDPVKNDLAKKGDASEEDRINNGALDNAAGVATMLEVVRRFRKSGRAPRRTIAVAAVTAEEKGLLGAGFLAAYPPFGDRRIVANVNLDMPLVLYPFTEFVAFGAERSTISDAVDDAAMALDLSATLDPVPEQSLFVRSDHYRFVEKGVPSTFIFLGFEDGKADVFQDFITNHYHSPSDDLALPIDYSAAAKFAELNYLIASDLANNNKTPSWREGDFFGERFGADASD